MSWFSYLLNYLDGYIAEESESLDQISQQLFLVSNSSIRKGLQIEKGRLVLVVLL